MSKCLVWGELIVSRYVTESITTDAGRFGHVGLCQLHIKTVLYTVDKGIYLPDIDNVAMSLYDIKCLVGRVKTTASASCKLHWVVAAWQFMCAH